MAAAWAELRAARAAVAEAREQAARAPRAGARSSSTWSSGWTPPRSLPASASSSRPSASGCGTSTSWPRRSPGALDLLAPDDGEGAQSLAARASELVAGGERFEPRAGADRRRAARRRGAAAGGDRRPARRGRRSRGRPRPARGVEQRLELFAELERRFGAPLERGGRAGVCGRASRSRCSDVLGRGDGAARGGRGRCRASAATAGRGAACTRRRRQAAKAFARAVEGELADLGMDGARLVVNLTEAPLGARGSDRCELLLAANTRARAGAAREHRLGRRAVADRARDPGGGAGSRRARDAACWTRSTPGVGGRTARAVGEKLQRLAEHAQVISITHLPQIASLADAHFRVEKLGGRSDPHDGRAARRRRAHGGARPHAGRR